jgi:DNA-binding GntR family transcriptional regulator
MDEGIASLLASDVRLDPSEPNQRAAGVTMTQSAVAALRDMIVSGELPSGSPLRLDEIASRLDMSVSPVREALRQLEVLGLVEHAAYKSATVTMLGVSEMTSVYESRVAIETLVIRRLAVRISSPEDLPILDGLLAGLTAAYDARDRFAVVRKNTEFHMALAALAGSRLFERLMEQIHNSWERYSAYLISKDRPEDTFNAEKAGHHAILTALRTGDPDAAELAMKSHLLVSRDIFWRLAEDLSTNGSARTDRLSRGPRADVVVMPAAPASVL